MTHLNIRLDIHNRDAVRTDPHLAADEVLHPDFPSFTTGGLFDATDTPNGDIAGTFISAEWDQDTPTWSIDQEGRVFFKGRWIATLTRHPEHDGTLSTAFLLEAVYVDRDLDAPVFDAAIPTANLAVAEEDWEAVNAAQGSRG